MLHKKTWVLVANRTRARVFSFLKDSLAELAVLTPPETKMGSHDAVMDRPHENETEYFAQELSQYLGLEHRMNQFKYLHLIVSPAFLGLLRHHLHPEIQKSVLTEVHKNVVGESARRIRGYLP